LHIQTDNVFQGLICLYFNNQNPRWHCSLWKNWQLGSFYRFCVSGIARTVKLLLLFYSWQAAIMEDINCIT